MHQHAYKSKSGNPSFIVQEKAVLPVWIYANFMLRNNDWQVPS